MDRNKREKQFYFTEIELHSKITKNSRTLSGEELYGYFGNPCRMELKIAVGYFCLRKGFTRGTKYCYEMCMEGLNNTLQLWNRHNGGLRFTTTAKQNQRNFVICFQEMDDI